MSTDAEVVRDLAQAVTAGKVLRPDFASGTSMAVAMPPGWTMNTIERFLDHGPNRIRARAEFADLAGFSGYFEAHKADHEHEPEVYFHEAAPGFIAIFDPRGWREHTAFYGLKVSDEWTAWTALNGKSQSQEEFALFIERNLPDIVKPDGATLLEMSLALEAKKDVKFASALRMGDGSIQFAYQEDVSGSSRKGTMQIPDTFAISIPRFLRTPRIAIEAKFRYRVRDGHLSLWYDLMRLQDVERVAIDDLVASTATVLGGRQIWLGVPGKPVREFLL